MNRVMSEVLPTVDGWWRARQTQGRWAGSEPAEDGAKRRGEGGRVSNPDQKRPGLRRFLRASDQDDRDVGGCQTGEGRGVCQSGVLVRGWFMTYLYFYSGTVDLTLASSFLYPVIILCVPTAGVEPHSPRRAFPSGGMGVGVYSF